MQRFSFPAFRSLLIVLALSSGVILSAVARSPVRLSSAVTVETCSWDRPGVNPFMGDVVAAVDRYEDIPPDVRARLKARMVARTYEDVVTIRRDSIQGKARYGTNIRDMHFGTHQVCRTVTRSAWGAEMQERGLVYCEGGDCILVPTVCRNVSRITRAQVAPPHAVADVPALDLVPLTPAGPSLAGPVPELPTGPLILDAPASASQTGTAGGSFAAGSIGGAQGFSATNGELSGAGSGASPGIHPSSALSDVQLSAPLAPIPEPEIWGLFLIGLCALGAVTRARARALSLTAGIAR